MAEEFETVEVEVSEDDIVYYLFDEQEQEIGFVVMEDGEEVEYFYEWVDIDAYEDLEAEEIEEDEPASVADEGEGAPDAVDLLDLDGETVEMEIDEDAIDHYLFDDAGNEIGFVIVEDGAEIECYYQDDEEELDPEGASLLDNAAAALAEAGVSAAPAVSPEPADDEPEEHGYLYKMAQIAGHEGNKARKKAGEQLNKARDKAAPVVDQARTKAEVGIDKATEAVESGGKKLKAKSDEYDMGITREGVAEATADLNAIAKEGAETVKELKEAYDDIMDSFGFLMPKSVRRKLP